MGILDDAIKEHLELKRQHGADASELKQLEDEAFGAAERPGDEDTGADPLAEAPTEFMQQPDAAEERPAEGAEAHEEPPEEESPAMEHEAVSEPIPEAPSEPERSGSHTTSEREAIAEHPTEMYDVEAELGASETRAPSDEELVEEEVEEPGDFFDEQRLSDELDQALEAPAEGEESAEDDELAEDEYDENEGEDVLEETPDFLEEAPEDDRLWFEQKPPKDFDFDD